MFRENLHDYFLVFTSFEESTASIFQNIYFRNRIRLSVTDVRFQMAAFCSVQLEALSSNISAQGS